MEKFAAAIAAAFMEKIVAFVRILISRIHRKMIQDAAKSKVDSDVQQSKPRDDDTRKNEEDFVNS